MTDYKKINSIGRKITSSWYWHISVMLFLSNALVVFLVVSAWINYIENNLPMQSYISKGSRGIQLVKNDTNEVADIVYVFVDSKGKSHKVIANKQVFILGKYLLILLFSETALLSLIYTHGKYKTYRNIKPIRDIAKTAEKISKLNIDEQKYKNLASAIDHLSPNSRLNLQDTELKIMEDSVNQLIERLHKNYEQQNQFVSDASHELRTPIAVIQGYINMLDRWGKDDEKVLTESIDAIKSESAYMKKLIEQLLFLARGDADKTNISFETINLSQIVKESYEEYAMIDNKHIWKIELEEYCMVYGDHNLLKQAIRILVDNAIKYSAENTPISFKTKIEGEHAVCIIQDNGIGINKNDISHIYDRFFRADQARNRKTGGIGLGLSLAKWIVDKHNGYFKVNSFENIGTIINMYIPINSGKQSS